MTRGITSAILSALRDNPDAIVLFALETKDTPSHIRLCNQERDVTFDGETYSGRAFGLDSVRVDGTEFPAVELTFADWDLFFDTWLQTTDFRGHKATMTLVTRDTMATATNLFEDSFRVLDFRRRAGEIVYTLQSRRAILSHVKRPRSMSRDEFPGILNEPIGRR